MFLSSFGSYHWILIVKQRNPSDRDDGASDGSGLNKTDVISTA